LDLIKQKTDQLNQVSLKVGQFVYSQKSPETNPGFNKSPDKKTNKVDDNTVDAEFEEKHSTKK